MVKKDLNIGCNLTRGILMTLSNLSFCASLFKKIIILFFFLFLAVLGFHCCTGLSLVTVNWGYPPVAVCRLLSAAGLCYYGAQA